MGILLDAGVADPAGASGLPAGIYHCVVEDSRIDEKTKKLKITLQCLAGRTSAGDTEGCVGMKKIEWFDLGPEDYLQRRLFQYAYATGLITLEQWDALFVAKQKIALDVDQTTGRQLCVEIQQKPGKEGTKNAGKMFDNIDGRMWPVDDPKVEHYPKDAKWLAQAGVAAPVAAPPTAAAPAAPATSLYGGF